MSWQTPTSSETTIFLLLRSPSGGQDQDSFQFYLILEWNSAIFKQSQNFDTEQQNSNNWLHTESTKGNYRVRQDYKLIWMISTWICSQEKVHYDYKPKPNLMTHRWPLERKSTMTKLSSRRNGERKRSRLQSSKTSKNCNLTWNTITHVQEVTSTALDIIARVNKVQRRIKGRE